MRFSATTPVWPLLQPEWVEEHIKRLSANGIQTHFQLANITQLETVERMMRTDVGRVPTTMTIAACRHEFALGSRPAVILVNNAAEYCGLVMLPELFSGDLDTIADDILVVELARYIDVVLLPDMNVKTAMAAFDAAESELLAVVESAGSRKVIGFLTESFARRRYVEEIDKATRGVLGTMS